MERLLQDLRFAARALRASPIFAAVAILSIGFGIGANTTVFSFVNAVYFAPLPFRDAELLYDVYEHNPREVCAGCSIGTSYASYLDLRQRVRSFSDVAAYRGAEQFLLNDGGEPVRLRGATVSAGLLELIGAAPIAGRLIQPADDRAGAPRVALLSESIWRSRYQADRALVGKSVRLNGDYYTIIGIMPEGQRFPDHAQVWVPIAPTVGAAARGERTISMMGKLARNSTPAAAETELNAIATNWQRDYSASNAGWTLHLRPLRSDLAGDFYGAWTLLLVVGFVLLIACANVAGLLIARGAARRKELGVRLALGAERKQLLQLLVTESLLIAVIGAGLGILLTLWTVDLINSFSNTALPFWSTIRIDLRVLGFTTLLTVLTGLTFGLLPALQAVRIDVAAFMKDQGRSVAGGVSGTRLRRVLVAGEIAAALLLLTGAGLLTKTFLRARTPNTAYETRGLMQADVRLMGSRYEVGSERARAVGELVERSARLTSVRSAAASSRIIVDWPEAVDRGAQLDGMSDAVADSVFHHVLTITPAYFATFGVSMTAGRAFTEADVAGAPLVGTVNQAFAEQVWRNQSPLGRRFRIGRSANAQWITIVGVVANMDRASLRGGPPPAMVYVPFAQHPIPQPIQMPVALHFRTTHNAQGFAGDLIRQAAIVDPQLAIESINTVEAAHAQWVRPFRTTASLMMCLSLFALGLALIGVYGITAFAAVSRRRELGIRMALGATNSHALRVILREGVSTALWGVAIGVPAAFALTRLIRGLLFGVNPADPVIYALTAAALGGAALLASYLPARQVLKIDPAETLRME
jgi:putative ABC transport system permease protein